MIEGSGSTSLTNGPKTMWIRIRNTGLNEHIDLVCEGSPEEGPGERGVDDGVVAVRHLLHQHPLVEPVPMLCIYMPNYQ
jgi:hypothetical protein